MANIIVNFPSCELTMTDIKPTTITDTTSSKGTSGQLLSSTGTGIDWINPPASTWVGTATSNLDMNSVYDIVKARSLDNNGGGITIGASVSNGEGITIGKSSGTGTTTIVGTLNSATIDRAGTIDIGTSNATTMTIGKTTANATITTTNIRGKVQFNGLSGSVGQYLKSEGTSLPPTWATLPASTFVPTATTNLNMDGFNINNCPNLNGNTTALNIGTGAGTTSTVIGKSGATTNIQGNVQFGSASGTSGQFLQSQGAGTTPIWVTGSGSWSGTALTDLNMNGFDIVGADSIDNSGAINIGATSATSVGIGSSTIPVTLTGSSVNVDGVVFNNNAISSCSSLNNSASGAIAIGDTQTNGILNIGTNANRTANVNIMNGELASGSVNIMGGTTAVGGVNISSGSSNNGTVNILTGSLSAGELNLATGATSNTSVNIVSGESSIGTFNLATGSTSGAVVNLATGPTSAAVVNIMTGANSVGDVNLGGGTAVLSFNRPLTLNYLASQAIASSAFLGGTVPTVYTGTNPNNSVVQIARVVLTVGVWILIGGARFSTPGASGFYALSISSSPTAIAANNQQSQFTPTNNAVGANLSRFVATDVNVTWYLVAQTPISCNMTNVSFIAYRIG